jgi:hypothetical protein
VRIGENSRRLGTFGEYVQKLDEVAERTCKEKNREFCIKATISKRPMSGGRDIIEE